MPLDVRSKLQRPIRLTLLGMAAVGWVLFVVVLAPLPQQNRQTRAEFSDVQRQRPLFAANLRTSAPRDRNDPPPPQEWNRTK
jgi:hypothetical protein